MDFTYRVLLVSRKKVKLVCFDKLLSNYQTVKSVCWPLLLFSVAHSFSHVEIRVPLLFLLKMAGDFRIDELLSKVVGSQGHF